MSLYLLKYDQKYLKDFCLASKMGHINKLMALHSFPWRLTGEKKVQTIIINKNLGFPLGSNPDFHKTPWGAFL